MDSESTLNVHHKVYFKNRAPWDYADAQLVTLCESCHGSMHEEQQQIRHLLSLLPVDGPMGGGEALGLLVGWMLPYFHEAEAYEKNGPRPIAAGSVASALMRSDLPLKLIQVLPVVLDDPLFQADFSKAVEAGCARYNQKRALAETSAKAPD
jgi:hypothetical protein